MAVQKFEDKFDIQTKAAGFYICEEYPFLGDSPDRLIRADTIVEIKCPYNGRESEIKLFKYFPFLMHSKTDSNEMLLNPSSNYYMQIQGQYM